MADIVTPSESGADRLRRAFGNGLSIEALGGGLHGRCRRVRGRGLDCAVRLPVGVADGFRLDCRAEQQLLLRLADAGLAPALVPTDPDLDLIATRYIATSRPWTATDAREPRNIDRLAARLRALHGLELELDAYACVAAAERYVALAAACNERGRELEPWADELRRLAGAFDTRFSGTTPCHNDLVASNVLDDGKLWLIDWEYAALSSPLLDLAGFAGLNELGPSAGARLVEAYYGEHRPPFDADDFAAAIRLVRLLALFWALAVEPSPATDRAVTAFADALVAVLR